MVVWTDPKTWSAGEALTKDLMNEQVRDNEDYLFARPRDHYECNEAADYTTTSTSFVDIDATDLKMEITTNGGDVMLHFVGSIANPGGGWYLDIDVDGARFAGDDGLVVAGAAAGALMPVAFSILVTGLSAAAHVFKLQWKVTAGTATLYAGAGTASADVHPQFWGIEI